ncbi:MAG: class II fumarate hydratase [Acidimicrobiia bacterium]|nr:class II fumarate hydratase [Acidimicrobiia bacterium]
MSADGETRTETDSMGPVEVPAARYWGAQTQRSLQNFAIGHDLMPVEVVLALVLLKKAAAEVNAELGRLDRERAALIVQACDDVVEGRLAMAEFPLSVWQTGSGTQTNMNVNEVVAARANEIATGHRGKDPVHPNDHVNMSQSSNDTFPTAMHVALAHLVRADLVPALEALIDALAAKRDEFAGIVKVGRTHLQDAVPLTLGQEVGGWVAQLEDSLERVVDASEGVCELAIGATAVGTGLNSHPEFAPRVARRLSELTGLALVPARNPFAALASHDAVVALSAAARGLAMALMKIANDVRWLASGPRSGLGELVLPANEPGSSIMPGKVNPTQCEALTMVCVQVFGNDASVAFAGSQGNFELNVYKPLMAFDTVESLVLLSGAMSSFRVHLVEGLAADEDRIGDNLSRSLMLVTALTPHIGYDRAAEIAKAAHVAGSTLREEAVRLGYCSAEEFDAWVRPGDMTHP